MALTPSTMLPLGTPLPLAAMVAGLTPVSGGGLDPEARAQRRQRSVGLALRDPCVEIVGEGRVAARHPPGLAVARKHGGDLRHLSVGVGIEAREFGGVDHDRVHAAAGEQVGERAVVVDRLDSGRGQHAPGDAFHMAAVVHGDPEAGAVPREIEPGRTRGHDEDRLGTCHRHGHRRAGQPIAPDRHAAHRDVEVPALEPVRQLRPAKRHELERAIAIARIGARRVDVEPEESSVAGFRAIGRVVAARADAQGADRGGPAPTGGACGTERGEQEDRGDETPEPARERMLVAPPGLG